MKHLICFYILRTLVCKHTSVIMPNRKFHFRSLEVDNNLLNHTAEPAEIYVIILCGHLIRIYLPLRGYFIYSLSSLFLEYYNQS